MKYNKLVGYRKMFGLNQSDVAKVLNIGINTYSSKENGNTEFNISEVKAITNLLKEYNPKLTIDEIFL